MGRRRRTRAQSARCDEEREERGLEQQVVPLEGEELLSGVHEREIERPRQDQAETRRDHEDEAEARDRAGDRRRLQRRVAGVQPEKRRLAELTAGLAQGREMALDGEKPATAEQYVDLHVQRQESREEDQPEQAQEKRPHVRPPVPRALESAVALFGCVARDRDPSPPRHQDRPTSTATG